MITVSLIVETLWTWDSYKCVWRAGHFRIEMMESGASLRQVEQPLSA